MESNEFEEVGMKSCSCYYFNEIIKIDNFDFDNIDNIVKSCKNILVQDISYKTLFGSKPLHIKFDEIDGFIKVYDGLDIQHYYIPFTLTFNQIITNIT